MLDYIAEKSLILSLAQGRKAIEKREGKRTKKEVRFVSYMHYKKQRDSFQTSISLHTSNNVKIEIRFHSVKDLMDFVKAYELK